MAHHRLETTKEDLPGELGVFPLNGVVLMPGGRLPVNVFEPRYLSLVMDALKEQRLIGMIQPRKAEDAAQGEPELYNVGCVGRISAFSETDDGRLLISLSGVCRFRAVKEAPSRNGYRRFAVDYAPYLNDFGDEGNDRLDRDHLLEVLSVYVERAEIDLKVGLLAGFSDPALIAALSMICPFAPREKQALLEASTVSARGEMLTALLEMDNMGVGGSDGPNYQ